MSSKVVKRVVKKEVPKKRVAKKVVVKKEVPKKRVAKKVVVKKRVVKVRKSRYAKEGIPKELFCGPFGGARAGSYPVNSPGRAIAAMSYARYAPNPQGIKECARRIALSKGWVNAKTGRITRVRK
jgi:hypothetical protein